MPRARNVTTGPEADAFDAAAKALLKAEKAHDAAREAFRVALVAAVDAEPPMGIAEAARRAGYTREHLSKLYAAAKNADAGAAPKPVGRPRKARDLMNPNPGPAAKRFRDAGH